MPTGARLHWLCGVHGGGAHSCSVFCCRVPIFCYVILVH